MLSHSAAHRHENLMLTENLLFMAHSASERHHPHAWSYDRYLLQQNFRRHGTVSCVSV